jgi:diacylglycerol O-acyltransferase / wax synthase
MTAPAQSRSVAHAHDDRRRRHRVTAGRGDHGMGEHLTPLDATFLELEEADASAHMHIGGIMVFDPLPEGGSPTLAALRAHLDARLERLPRYRQRLSQTHTGGLSWPQWLEDPDFAIARHVTRAALPDPGGEQELEQWASCFFSQRLDRRRPLWEIVLLEGLADGRWALASKTHHCMVDGVGSVDVAYLLLDTVPAVDPRPVGAAAEPAAAEPAARPAASRHRAPTRAPRQLAALSRAWESALGLDTLVHAAELGARGVRHPRETLRSARAAVELIVREELRGAPHTSLNGPIGTLRRFTVVRARLDDLREIKSALGGTVNDVALAAVGSGLRELLAARGEQLPARGLRAMVPMNVRTAGEHMALGNRVSSLFVELPVADPDLLARYRDTVARSRALKSDGQQAAGTSAVIELAGLAPPVIHVTLAQALYATRLFNLTITNVPGPQQTLYGLGAPLREVHPLVPLAACHAVGVAVVSYDGEVFFGVVCDRDSVPDIEVMTDAIGATIAELLMLCRRPARRAPRLAAVPVAGGAAVIRGSAAVRLSS